MEEKELEKEIDTSLKKKAIIFADKFIDFSFNLLFTAAMLWLAVNIFLKVFSFSIRMKFVQAVATIFLYMVLSWIFGRGDRS